MKPSNIKSKSLELFILLFLPSQTGRDLISDLQENYDHDLAKHGKRIALLIYNKELLLTVPHYYATWFVQSPVIRALLRAKNLYLKIFED